jgi:mannitol operon transcriptional antiterminator
MTALTTRQRDLLKVLLKSNAPLGAEDLAMRLRLTPRQVSYGLKGVRHWLNLREIDLAVTPGVGMALQCSAEQTQALLQELSSSLKMQLVLSVEERQQLLLLVLLVADSPMFMAELEEISQVSRSTIGKDLDEVEKWIEQWGMQLVRRQNFGIELSGGERLHQELIAALLWGETPFGKPLTEITHKQGLIFKLHNDANLLSLVGRSDWIIEKWDMQRVFAQVAYAEVQLGGRFTDDAVLHIALVLAIQTDRVSNGHHLDISQENVDWLKTLPVWDVARMVAKRLGWKLSTAWRDTEAYGTPEMKDDRTLHDGIVNHLIPACLRQKLDLWMPSLALTMTLPEKFETEYRVARSIASMVEMHTALNLPAVEVNNIASLLRAARIRIRPYRFSKVIIVCPSGMATAQLLMARLEARFPRLGPLEVVSMRKLDDEQLRAAELIITTAPLDESISSKIAVLQVHPLLLPEDVERITDYLS